mmetsp:Transcript_18976/g.21183  ORF Transcript_18976/g.21183 Transcript_18976/m.21183 type:complete len:294 (+) Transcript_18976:2-883(+)
MKISINYTLLYILCWLEPCMARFSVGKPVVTLTLKDLDENRAAPAKWLDISALKAKGSWSFQSKGPPLPNSVPFFKSLRGNIFTDRLGSSLSPDIIHFDLRFAKEGLGDLQIQPDFNVRQKSLRCTIQAIKGNSMNIMVRLGRKIETIKGNFILKLPGSLPLTMVKVSPTINLLQINQSTFDLEGITPSARTKAILSFQGNRSPMLTIAYSMNDNNIISPQISLSDAKIIYNWDIMMESGSIHTTVDPTDAIDIQWTDRSMNGRWVTDVNLPLKGTTLKQLALNLRVRRQFSF